MALYEQAENKNDKNMLLELVNKFDKAISEGARDAVYLNYYGYTLIDKEMDIEKGIQLVKEALLTDDNNTYYLDSLAWGYYKQNRCEKAKIAMKKVVDIEGLDEDDILDHWTKIKACK
jgi:tetratricopeptide (TPR) repeat protein